MDLLRVVLLRLPVDRLIDLREVVDHRFIRERLKVVNQLETDLASDFDPYIKFCIFQGELVENPVARLSAGTAMLKWLAPRAIFLRNARLYRQYLDGLNRDFFDLNAGLQSDVPEIRAASTSHFVPHLMTTPINYGAIQWTDEMKRDLLARFYPGCRYAGRYLFGYLSYPGPLTNVKLERRDSLFEGYIAAALENRQTEIIPTLETVAEDLCISSDIPWGHVQYCLEVGGYRHYDGDDSALHRILRHINPDHLELKLRTSHDAMIKCCRDFDIRKMLSYVAVNELLLKRVRKMLAIDRTNRMIFSSVYRTYLRILLGQSVELEEFNTDQKIFFIHQMIQIAHPQLTSEMFEMVHASIGVRSISVVTYDLINYFKVCESPFGDWYNLQILVGRGQLMEIRDTMRFKALWNDPQS